MEGFMTRGQQRNILNVLLSQHRPLKFDVISFSLPTGKREIRDIKLTCTSDHNLYMYNQLFSEPDATSLKLWWESKKDQSGSGESFCKSKRRKETWNGHLKMSGKHMMTTRSRWYQMVNKDNTYFMSSWSKVFGGRWSKHRNKTSKPGCQEKQLWRWFSPTRSLLMSAMIRCRLENTKTKHQVTSATRRYRRSAMFF